MKKKPGCEDGVQIGREPSVGGTRENVAHFVVHLIKGVNAYYTFLVSLLEALYPDQLDANPLAARPNKAGIINCSVLNLTKSCNNSYRSSMFTSVAVR